MIQSMYFAGPEGLNLEVCCGSDIDERQWIDPEVQELCGISADELQHLIDPAPLEVGDQPVPQPATDESKPRMNYPPEAYEFIMGMSGRGYVERVQRDHATVPLPE